VSTSRTGDDGHDECHFVAIDIFNGKKLEYRALVPQLMHVKDGFTEGKNLVVSVMSAIREEAISPLKDILSK
nr:eukaryotic translation initiation factor 5A-like [Tanacetum cinerariifolium]